MHIVSEMVHLVAAKIALISITFAWIFNPNLAMPDVGKTISIHIGPQAHIATSTPSTFPSLSDVRAFTFPQIHFPALTQITQLIPHAPPLLPTRKIPDTSEVRTEEAAVIETEAAIQPEMREPQKEESDLPPLSSDAVTYDIVTQETRNAVVNILCTTNINTIGSATGSGVIVDPRGIILTNAHVAQLFLLKGAVPDLNIDCVIRAGDPAESKYLAELMYISPTWVEKHPDTLALANPTGTGENDFAFLLITQTYNHRGTLPTQFPFVVPDTTYMPDIDDVLILAGYPAGFLDGFAITTNLRLNTIAGYVTDIFTFDKKTVDLFEIKDTVVAQKGSSGGAVVHARNKLAGIIVTNVKPESGNAESAGLRAITIGHIHRELLQETGKSLNTFLEHDPQSQVTEFRKNEAPELAKKIVDAIFK